MAEKSSLVKPETESSEEILTDSNLFQNQLSGVKQIEEDTSSQDSLEELYKKTDHDYSQLIRNVIQSKSTSESSEEEPTYLIENQDNYSWSSDFELPVPPHFYLLSGGEISDIESDTDTEGSSLDLELDLSDTNIDENNKMAEYQALKNTFNSLSLPCETYSGVEGDRPVTDFIDDFKDYIKTTGKTSPAQIKVNENMVVNPDQGKLEKLLLKQSLKGPARIWFDGLKKDTSYENCLVKLKTRFELTDQQIHKRSVQLSRIAQQPGEEFLQYVTRVSLKARGLDIDDKKLLAIIIEGALPSIKPFIEMCGPESMDELLKYPLIHGNGGLETEYDS